MPYTTFDYTLDGHVAEIKFNRPDKLNTMVPEFWTEMIEVFDEIERTPPVRAVVISSSGKHFTAGMDLSVFGGLGHSAASTTDRARINEQLRRSVLETQESFNVIEACRVPVLAAIQGGCIGGGVDLVTACDMRYCTTDAFFCIQEINIGMVADVGTLQRLPHLIPAGMVRELAYTGRRFPAAEAKANGLVNAVYADPAAMLDAVMATAREIATKSPLAVHGTKEVLKYTRDHTVADGLNYIAVWNAGMLLTEDMAEQMQANKEKRPAKFADLLPPRKIARKR
jgi:enoyl-CoA hydratase